MLQPGNSWGPSPAEEPGTSPPENSNLLQTAPKVVGASAIGSSNQKLVSPDYGVKPDDLLWREERRERRRRLRQERMDDRQRRYGLLLCIASAFDVFISGFMMCVAFAHGYLDNGVSLYCLGIQALSHALSSALLAMRFWDEYMQPPEATDELDHGLLREKRRSYLIREKVMSFAMGMVMMVSSSALLVKALRKMFYWDVWYKDHINMDHDAEFATVFLAWYGVVVYSAQAVLRLAVSQVLKRAVVRYSVSCSMVSLLYLFVIAMAAMMEDEWSWKAEPVFATILACVTVAEGGRLIYTHRGSVDLKLDIDAWA